MVIERDTQKCAFKKSVFYESTKFNFKSSSKSSVAVGWRLSGRVEGRGWILIGRKEVQEALCGLAMLIPWSGWGVPVPNHCVYDTNCIIYIIHMLYSKHFFVNALYCFI